MQIGFHAFIDQNNQTYQSIQEEMDALNEVQVDMKTFDQVSEAPKKENKSKYQGYKKDYFFINN